MTRRPVVFRCAGPAHLHADAQAAPFPYDLVVILGTNHTVPGFPGVSIWGGSGFRTPLGIAPVDRALARELADADPDFTHDAAPHRSEPSIEVQVPFVQRLFPQAAILPVVVGSPDVKRCTRFGEALGRALRGRRALVVASSDLAHYPSHDDAVVLDHRTLRAIAALDPEGFQHRLRERPEPQVPEPDTRARAAEGSAHTRMITDRPRPPGLARLHRPAPADVEPYNLRHSATEGSLA